MLHCQLLNRRRNIFAPDLTVLSSSHSHFNKLTKKQDANIAVFAYAVQNAVKYFDIDINKQNPDNYPLDKVDAAIRMRFEMARRFYLSHHGIEIIDGPEPSQTNRGLFSSSKSNKPKKPKHKHRPSKLLYGALAIYLWRHGHKELAFGEGVAHFVHRHYANTGDMEKLLNFVLGKVSGQGGRMTLRNTDEIGSEGKGVDFSKFNLD